MTHYIDIELLPKKEMRENYLLNQLYTAFHKRLYDLKSKSIGVSFPRYRLKLGTLLRVHGSLEDLEKLQEKEWLGEYKIYTKVSSIKKIPQEVSYRTVYRVQQNMTEAKLRRLIKRGTISQEDVKKYKVKMLQGGLENPYVELKSASNGQFHRRFLEFGELKEKSSSGEFDFFGLSKDATIPWF